MRNLKATIPALLLLLHAGTALLSPMARAEPVTLNLEEAEIGTLIATVSEVTGRNFVVDPRVKGKVSVVSSMAMEKEELYQVFLSILEVHGFAAVPSGNVIKIVPDANAKHIDTPFASDQAPGVGDEIVTRVVQVKNVSAAQLVPILRPLVPQQGHLAAYPATNVLVVSDRAGNIERLVKIIARIDQKTDAEIEVINLQHAAAAEVVRIITALQRPAQGQAVLEGSLSLPSLVADERTNSILMSGDQLARLRVRALITHLDTPLETTGNTHVVYLRYARAAELASVLTDISGDIQQDEGGGQGAGGANNRRANEVGIRADEASNALVITAPPEAYASLRQVISRLDIRRAQVLVEAIIAEVRSENAAELGVQLRDLVGGSDGSFVITNPQGPNSPFVGADAASTLSGLTLGLVRNGDIRGLLRALATSSDTNLIATPTLLTLDNEEAAIVVGQNVPFLTGSFTNDATTPDNPFQTIERRDVGLELTVTPQINEGDAMSLVISQEVSSIDDSAQAVDLITTTRSINTTVLVDDGEIVVLGGLIRDDFQTTEQKVPLLGDLPVLGNLFRSTSTDSTKNNLMVFIKPTIVRNRADIAHITSSKYNFLRAKQLEQPGYGVPFKPAMQVPLLAPFAETSESPAPQEKAPAPQQEPRSLFEYD
ncbi:MAG: type II secretion system secretin GspD [Gammaproteobacteria bacterium]|nr:type II secretion system secretin GspD [Gammaproteobacteria bacterium]